MKRKSRIFRGDMGESERGPECSSNINWLEKTVLNRRSEFGLIPRCGLKWNVERAL